MFRLCGSSITIAAQHGYSEDGDDDLQHCAHRVRGRQSRFGLDDHARSTHEMASNAEQHLRSGAKFKAANLQWELGADLTTQLFPSQAVEGVEPETPLLGSSTW